MKHVILLLLLVILSESGWSQEVKYTEFKYENGVVSSEGNMVNGQPEGYWNTFYENGTVKSEGNRKDHLLDGLWKFYATNGTITQSIEYAKGKKNGTSTKHYEDGVVEKTEQFISDVKVGEIRRFHPSGSLMAIIPMDTLGKGREHGKGYEFSDGDERIIAVTEFRNGFVGSRERINRKDKFNQKQGLWREFYEDRSVSLEGRYKNGKRNGYFKSYDEEGNLVETLKYVDGILIPEPEELAKLDIRREYHPNAQVKSVGSYSKDVKEGVHRIYKMDGEVESAKIFNKGKVVGDGIVDAEGRRQGDWKEFYETGELRSQGKYKDGLRVGMWVFYYQDGKEEQRGEYHKGKPDGDWKWTYNNGSTWREEVFYDGLEEGIAIEYNDTGKVISKGSYIGGERDGEWLVDLGDHREEGSYVAGLKQGLWKYYYPSGKKRFEGKFVQGRQDGKHEHLYENGQIKIFGRYKFGLKEGEWFNYSEDGEVTRTFTYSQGEVIKVDGEKVVVEKEEDNP